jgi:XTP/dITP diphosphohydrolase/tetrapyrrole methylase family protein/MazG family protein/ATP diphosphatase
VTEPAGALLRLDEITRRLRRECPWDREQDERSIVPHTVEEAYELADAAHSGDDAKLLDELGDVLFQVYFLALLLEERGAGSLAEVADHCRQKLIRRHPHVFGEAQAASAAEVLDNWDRIKRETERGGEIFGELPETLPSTLYARKILRRAEGAGRRWGEGAAAGRLREDADRLAAADTREARFEAAGDLLLAAVELVREAGVDPELALRAAADRFKHDTEREVRRPT